MSAMIANHRGEVSVRLVHLPLIFSLAIGASPSNVFLHMLLLFWVSFLVLETLFLLIFQLQGTSSCIANPLWAKRLYNPLSYIFSCGLPVNSLLQCLIITRVVVPISCAFHSPQQVLGVFHVLAFDSRNERCIRRSSR